MAQPPKAPQAHYEGLDAVTTSPIPILLPGGGVTILSGATGIGKTAFVAQIVKAVLDGEGEILGCPVFPTAKKVGIIVTDRDWAEAHHWYTKHGVVKGPRFTAYCLQDDYGVKWVRFTDAREHRTLFNEALDLLDLPPQSLVVVDPISPFLGSNLNDYSKTFAAIGPLNQALKKRQLTALGLHHVMKMKKDPNNRHVRPQDRILGSTAIASFTNTQIYLMGPEENEKPNTERWYTIGFVPHNSQGRELRFSRDADGRFIPYVAAAAHGLATVEPISGSDEQLNDIFNLLQTVGPITTAEHNARISAYFEAKREKPKTPRQMDRYREVLAEQKRIYSPRRGFWMRGQPETKEEETTG